MPVEPLRDPEFSRAQSAQMRKLITDRIRTMPPSEFAELLRTATKEDEWLLLLHGAVLGLAGGLIHLLLVIALVVLIINLLSGRSTAV